MDSKIVLTGTTGKIGGATLEAILSYKLVSSPSDLVIATSSSPDDPRLSRYASLGVTIRHSDYSSVESMVLAFSGCSRLFLVSTSHVDLDFHDCAKGGREKHHFNAFEAAKRAGIKHVYYTSLAFGSSSSAAVMRAHLRTEEFLKTQSDFKFTSLREGLYNESWPLYLGHYDVSGGEQRDKIVIGPGGPISWTSIADLGLASAMIVAGDADEWAGKTVYLSARKTLTVSEVAALVEHVRGKPLSVEVTSQQEYVRHYVNDKGMDTGFVEWWSSTYPALEDGECKILESPFEQLLASKGRVPETMENTVRSMLSKS